jgi:hypothetical protein
VRLVEIYQAQRGSYEFDGCFKQSRPGARGRVVRGRTRPPSGLQVGFIASSDHGEGRSYACALAESLDRESIFDALRARRTYGATAKGHARRLPRRRPPDGGGVRGAGRRRDPRTMTLRARGTRELVDAVVVSATARRGGRSAAARPRRRAHAGDVAARARAAEQPRAADWSVRCGGRRRDAQVGFELPGYAKDDLGPDRPQWSIATKSDGVVAEYVWKRSYAGLWEPMHFAAARRRSARRAAAPRERTVVARDVALGELAAASVGGDSPLGALASLGARGVSTRRSTSRGRWACASSRRSGATTRRRAARAVYYARVIQADGEMAWSSPIYMTR